ncbi:ubiquitin-protein ligase (E3) [Collariella sp. IMI 366227]|nr:ubiquitin-protein ligase (E3) [Collariella sp. IMI 366227]
MFQTFSGSSRKTRNVNLSGQKPTNPFNSTSWSPGGPGGSKTVAHAQAERLQRQQERERLRAAQCLQKSWRGHRVRRNLRISRREAFDRLYHAEEGLVDLQRRTLEGTRLLLFAADVDVDRLFDSFAASELASSKTSESQTGLMWLLAHFIVLQKTRNQLVLHSRSIQGLYSLLSTLSAQIRAGFAAGDLKPSGEDNSIEDAPQPILPPYVSDKLASLTDRDEISGLLEKFTSHEDAGFLAGYILTLIYCFPTLGDDILMRLYLADIPTSEGSVPAVKFFWHAVRRTSIFAQVVSDPDVARSILRQKRTPQADSLWHHEWRTILLFLELYIFVLRLTDDDDFFSGLGVAGDFGMTPSRVSSNGLNLASLKPLTLFLKHLGFTLHYHAADLLGPAVNPLNAPSSSQLANAPSFVLTAGFDLESFRNLVTTAIKMLYERDSRRPFLPQNHWLMTSKFDMEGFQAAVVLEEERQREQEEEGGDEDEEDEEEQNLYFSTNGSRLSRQAQLERIRVARKRAARDSRRAAAAPKLEILRHMPFVIPFETRVNIFRQFVYLDKHRRRGGHVSADNWRLWMLNEHGGFGPDLPNAIGRHQAQIQRGRVFADAMDAFWDLREGLKEPIQISFVDEFGFPEAGIDGGGVTKEFLTSVITETFTPKEGLFVANSKNSYYPNPCDMDQLKTRLRDAQIPEDSEPWKEAITHRLRQYEFLGRVIGKCMYEGILIDIAFAGFFLLKWATTTSPTLPHHNPADTYRANINDLRELDESLYQGMMRLKKYPGSVSDLALDFTITDQISLPSAPAIRTITRSLVPNGEDIPVTNENRPLYISYVARHRLAVQPYPQTRAFLRGLGAIIDPSWLGMFNQNELQRLVGGDSSEIDVDDLRRNTAYSGVYQIGDDGLEHPTVQLFWEVMRGMEDRERRDVLKYVTSTPRAPLLGFGKLSPRFTIRDAGLDQERLPSASTCVNLLKLPQYRSAETLKKKLLYAVQSGAGFDLS